MVKELKAVLASRQAHAVLRKSAQREDTAAVDSSQPAAAADMADNESRSMPGESISEEVSPAVLPLSATPEVRRAESTSEADEQEASLPIKDSLSHAEAEVCSAESSATSVVPPTAFAPRFKANMAHPDGQTPASMAQMAAMLALRARTSAGLGDVQTFGSDEESDESADIEDNVDQ